MWLILWWGPVLTLVWDLSINGSQCISVEQIRRVFGDNYCKFLKYSDTQKICCNHSIIWTMWLYHRVMSTNDADGMANSVDPYQTRSSLIWVCTICPDISVRKLRIITVKDIFRLFLHKNICCGCSLELPRWGDCNDCLDEAIGDCNEYPQHMFLAHLSRRLTRWTYRMGLGPASVRLSVHPHFQTWISPRPAGQLQSNFIWSIIGVGERLH